MILWRALVVIVLAFGVLAALFVPAPVVAASGMMMSGPIAQWYGANPIQPFLMIDALPIDAQVYVDGRPLGTARDLLARALAIAPGAHSIAIVAPGFSPYSASFATDPKGFSTRVQVTLIPQ
jgi:hypothetical protein